MSEKIHLRLRLIPESGNFEFVFDGKTSEVSLSDVRRWITELRGNSEPVQLDDCCIIDPATQKRVSEYFETVLDSAGLLQ